MFNLLISQRKGDESTTQQKLPPLKIKKEKKWRPVAQANTSVLDKNKHVKLPQMYVES